MLIKVSSTYNNKGRDVSKQVVASSVILTSAREVNAPGPLSTTGEDKVHADSCIYLHTNNTSVGDTLETPIIERLNATSGGGATAELLVGAVSAAPSAFSKAPKPSLLYTFTATRDTNNFDSPYSTKSLYAIENTEELQDALHGGHICLASPVSGVAAPSFLGTAFTYYGTNTLRAVDNQGIYGNMPKTEMLAAAATTAIAGFRQSTLTYGLNGTQSLHLKATLGLATGSANVNARGFFGFMNTVTATTDLALNARLNCFGFGWDNTATNIQFVHNNGSGTGTKIDTGIPKYDGGGGDRNRVYDVEFYITPFLITGKITDINDGLSYTVSIPYYENDTAKVPFNSSGEATLAFHAIVSAGGTSSAMGLALFNFYSKYKPMYNRYW